MLRFVVVGLAVALVVWMLKPSSNEQIEESASTSSQAPDTRSDESVRDEDDDKASAALATTGASSRQNVTSRGVVPGTKHRWFRHRATVVDEDQRPLAGVGVYDGAFGMAHDALAMTPIAMTDQRGRFSIASDSSMRMFLFYVPTHEPRVRAVEGMHDNTVVRLYRVKSPFIVLVQDEAGAPLPGVTVTCPMLPGWQHVTGDDGTAALALRRQGSMSYGSTAWIQLRHEAYLDSAVGINLLHHLNRKDPIAVTLRKGVAIAGRAVWAGSGTPFGPGNVMAGPFADRASSLQIWPIEPKTAIAADGSFELLAHAATSVPRFSEVIREGVTVFRRSRLQDGVYRIEPNRFSRSDNAAKRLRVQLIDHDGSPIADATVAYGGRAWEAKTDQDGWVELEQSRNFTQPWAIVLTPDGRRHRAWIIDGVIRLQPTFVVRGRVRNHTALEKEASIVVQARATLRADTANAYQHQSWWISNFPIKGSTTLTARRPIQADGTFELEGLPRAIWTFEIAGLGAASGTFGPSVHVDLRKDASPPFLELDAPALRRLGGVVVDEEGGPIANAIVDVPLRWNEATRMLSDDATTHALMNTLVVGAQARTDADGRFRLFVPEREATHVRVRRAVGGAQYHGRAAAGANEVRIVVSESTRTDRIVIHLTGDIPDDGASVEVIVCHPDGPDRARLTGIVEKDVVFAGGAWVASSQLATDEAHEVWIKAGDYISDVVPLEWSARQQRFEATVTVYPPGVDPPDD